MKIYQVFHHYDTDGGFGDAIPQAELIQSFQSKKDAEAFVERFGNRHVYDTPYANLYCGDLWIKESEVVSEDEFDIDSYDPADFWWCEDYDTAQTKLSAAIFWLEFSEISVDENGCITDEYDFDGKFYEKGTSRETIVNDFKSTLDAWGVSFDEVVALASQGEDLYDKLRR